MYVEKYSRLKNEVWLDFVHENEFLYCRSNGDYLPSMHLSPGQYEPTMIRIKNCILPKRVKEGSLLTVDINELIQIKVNARETGQRNVDQEPELPAMVFVEIDDGIRFAELLKKGTITPPSRIRSEYTYKFSFCKTGTMKALYDMQKNFELRIWDVGQGCTVSASDEDNLVLFDFGASIHFVGSHLEEIIKAHDFLWQDKESIVLIISHWDSDHYNLLTAVEPSFFGRLDYVICTDHIRTLSAKLTADRIALYCGGGASVTAPKMAVKNCCGIKELFHDERFRLFTGENSSDTNKSGLLMTLYGENTAALLTADHTNHQVWNAMYKESVLGEEMLHAIVPHHGGDCGKTPVRRGINNGKAVISVGEDNMYGHPCKCTTDAYKDAHFKLFRTDEEHGDITIEM